MLPAVIHLADYMTQKLNIGSFQWDEGFELDEDIVNVLGFKSRAKLEEYIDGQSELFKKQLESVTI